MACLARDKSGNHRILFYAPDGSRKTIRLGKCSKKFANEVTVKAESLLSFRITGESPDRQTSLWLSGITPTLRDKLAKAGLVEPLEPVKAEPAVTLDAFLTDFMDRNGPSKKPATRVVWGQVMGMLREYMPKDIALADVTTGHAKSFVEKLKARGLASATISKRVGFARQYFQDAVDWELIGRNPFATVKTATSSLKSNVEVPVETIRHVLRHCDTTWATIVGLSRFGGLRCPSETLSITWGDIDWENGRMSVPEPKVEHHEGRGVRSVPLFPELRPILEAAFKEATNGTTYPSAETFVVNKPGYRAAAMRPGGWANANLRTQFLKILTRAGVPVWDRLFHSMRASRQTELERTFPRHVVCAWMGNTAAVAEKNYLLVTDADFAAAVNADGVTDSDPKAAPKAALLDPKAALKAAPQGARNEQARNEETPENTRENIVSAVVSGAFGMEDRGLEHLAKSPVNPGVSGSAALLAALLDRDPLSRSLVWGWALLDQAGKAEVLELISRLVEGQQASVRQS